MTIDAAFTQFPFLTTKRLLLRNIVPSDAKELFAILSDQQVTKFYGHEPHQSVDERDTSTYERREALRWGITLKNEDKLIGSCSLFHFDVRFDHAETGYELNRAFWGKGIMTEVMAAILTYGFRELKLHRVEAIIDILNERYAFRDRFEDEHYLGLLEEEWNEPV